MKIKKNLSDEEMFKGYVEKESFENAFDADEKKGEKIIVTKELVASKLDDIVDNVDTARYIL